MKLKDLKISTRLFVTFGLLIAVLVAVIGVAITKMSDMNAVTHEITTNWLPSVELVNKMNTNTSDYRITELTHVLNTDEQAMAAIEKEAAVVLADFENSHQLYQKLISSPEERKLYDSFAAEWKQYLQIHETVMSLSHKNENEKAKALLEGESRKLFDHFSDTLLKLVDLNAKGAENEAKLSVVTFATARNTMLAAGTVGVTFAILAAFLLVRSITLPLQAAVAIADRVAKGDLTSTAEAVSKDETGRMLQALQLMQTNLAQIVGEVRACAETLSSASEEISATAQSMSQASNEQAASVEETSASVEQMTASITQNTENAKVTDGMAVQAAQQAGEGGQAVGQTVEAMKQIAKRISIIDDIAYQTNLLALNAAIEAARAGEVRKLAERSQVAAQEIGEMAGNSVAVAEKAGKLLTEMVPAIKKTSDLVQEITAASEEQSSSVGQVNTAMVQLNQITQQNASSSEELAATAEEMSGQAQQLQQLVAFFKIEASDAGMAARNVKKTAAGQSAMAHLAARPALASIKAPEQKDFVKF